MKKGIYIIQKVISAKDIHEALRNERKARIVEVVLTNHREEKLDSLIGFSYNPRGDEDEIEKND